MKPYPQEALGGEFGLTSQDIANALGARHDNVKRHMKAISALDKTFTLTGWKVSFGGGRPGEIFIVPVSESKMVVAKYANEVGTGYLRFLIECEKVATELTPQLIAKLKPFKPEELYTALDLRGLQIMMY